jgi:uncharacterized protein YjiS (DUF1127 family)
VPKPLVQDWTASPYIEASPPVRQARSVAIQKLWPRLRLWRARRRQRQALWAIAESDDRHLLDDIGVSREAALREAAKPFWR